MSMAALLARRARGVRAHGVSARGLTPRLLRHSSGSAWPRIDAASVVDDATAAAFRRDGAVKLEALASPRWVEALRAAAERNLADPGPLCDEHAQAAGTGGRFHDDQFLWTRHDTFREWVQESGVAAVAARAMGSETAHIFYDQLFVKEPGTVLRENQYLRRVRAESSRRPPRHRRNACSMAWRSGRAPWRFDRAPFDSASTVAFSTRKDK